jgi:hypothetical protein
MMRPFAERPHAAQAGDELQAIQHKLSHKGGIFFVHIGMHRQ